MTDPDAPRIAAAMQQATSALEQALDAEPELAAELLEQLLPDGVELDDVALEELDDLWDIAPEDGSDLMNLAQHQDDLADEGDEADPLFDDEGELEDDSELEDDFGDDEALDMDAALSDDADSEQDGEDDELDEADEDDEGDVDETDEDDKAPTGAEPSSEPARKVPPPRPVTRGYPRPPCTLLVQQGDCIYSLAARYGHRAETLWDAAENEQLRKDRKGGILLPGDPVFIPELEVKRESAQTGTRHDFQVDSQQVKVSLRFLADGEPRKGIAYTLTVEDRVYKGKTDGDGAFEVWVAPTRRRGELVLHDPAGEETYRVTLGDLNPTRDPTGAQARLNHLGYRCGRVDGDVGPLSSAALLAFQHDHDLSLTGDIDDDTIAKLEELHCA